MFIKTMSLKNYRCYEALDINFNKDYTILVGVNGSGKSTVLDAVSTALGSYIAGFDHTPSNGISRDDARRKMYELGSRIENEAQYPVEIEAVCDVGGEEISWKRSLHGKEGRTHTSKAKAMMEFGAYKQRRVRDGDKDTILPLIAYYGTGRLYMQKKQSRSLTVRTDLSRTAGYMDCLTSASNDKQMLKWFELMTSIQLQEGKIVPELEAVKKAMGKCYAGADRNSEAASFEYKLKSGELEIQYCRDGKIERLPMRMLSDGLKITISMVADIAYRMAVLNPQLLENVLEAPGIVLIDEVDMHLHPKWQKRIVKDLHVIFPNVQFIMTTHSPTVLANVKREHILLLSDDKVYEPNNTTYGREISAILRELMGVDIRPKEVIELKDEYYAYIAREDYPEAKIRLEKLEGILGAQDADVVEAKMIYDLETV